MFAGFIVPFIMRALGFFGGALATDMKESDDYLDRQVREGMADERRRNDQAAADRAEGRRRTARYEAQRARAAKNDASRSRSDRDRGGERPTLLGGPLLAVLRGAAFVMPPHTAPRVAAAERHTVNQCPANDHSTAAWAPSPTTAA